MITAVFLLAGVIIDVIQLRSQRT